MHSSQNVCCNEKNENLELLSSSIHKTVYYLHSLNSKSNQRHTLSSLTSCNFVYQVFKLFGSLQKIIVMMCIT